MDKYDQLRDLGTNGVNYDIDTQEIIRRLKEWDEKFGVTLSEIGADRVTVSFTDLPDDLGELANEIYEFCPDVVDQGFGCFSDFVEAAETQAEPDPGFLELTAGVDFEDENYGLEILRRCLKRDKTVWLWWD
jgi:hypothetical protein